jgi:protein-tyrosine-phosphatase
MNTYNILFICSGNSARSLLGEILATTLSQGRLIGYSAGSKPDGEVHPLVYKLANQTQYDPAKLRCKSWDEFAAPGAPEMDFIITVCDDAADEVCPFWPGHPETIHWGFADPSVQTASEEQTSHAFEQVEIGLRNRIEFLLDLPLESLDRLAIKQHLLDVHHAK